MSEIFFAERRIYPILPTSTISNGMGKERWKLIQKYVKRKYNTAVICIEHRDGGPQIRVGGITGKLLGTIARVEKLAKKEKK